MSSEKRRDVAVRGGRNCLDLRLQGRVKKTRKDVHRFIINTAIFHKKDRKIRTLIFNFMLTSTLIAQTMYFFIDIVYYL